MTGTWFELDDQVWRIFGGAHRLLLSLAGQIPDQVLHQGRAMLGAGDVGDLPELIFTAAAAAGIPLTPLEADFLADLPEMLGAERPVAIHAGVTIEDRDPSVAYQFSPVQPEVIATSSVRIPSELDLTGGDSDDLTDLPIKLGYLLDLKESLTDLIDQLVVDALIEHAGVIRVWRTWRLEPGGADTSARRLYLVEVAAAVPAWQLGSEIEVDLVRWGDETATVDIYWVGDQLSPYHAMAQSHSALLLGNVNRE